MPLMDWDSSLDVGVERMNREHQDILALMNEIYDVQQAGRQDLDVIRLVDRLGQVTIEHFRDEEAFMETSDYAGLESHKLIHQDLLRKFTGFAEEIRAGNGQVPDKFLTFLKLWLSAHIKGIDMKYGPKAGQLLRTG